MWIPKLLQKQAPNDTNDGSFLFKDKNTGIIGYLNKNRLFETLSGLSATIIQALNGSSDPSEDNPFATISDLDFVNASILDVKAVCPSHLQINQISYTYNNGTAGVGATLTAPSNGAFPSQDGVSSVLGNVYLVVNQVNKKENGVYELTTLGNGSTKARLTRVEGADEITELYPLKVFVSEGTLYKNFTYAQKTVDPVIGTSNIVFEQVRTSTISTTPNVILVDTATSAAITGLTYTDGTLTGYPGVGATITKNGAFPTINGVTPFIGMLFLLKDESGADEYMNGVYRLNSNNGTSWSASRSALVSNNINKKVVCVSNSTSSVYGDFYACDNTNTATSAIGTDAISFSEISAGATDKNIATNDLVFTADSTTDFAGYKATFDNAEVKIVAYDNTSGNVPFEVTQPDGTSIFKVLGNKSIVASVDAYDHYSEAYLATCNLLAGTIFRLGINTSSPYVTNLLEANSSGLAIYSSNNVTISPTNAFRQKIRAITEANLITELDDIYAVKGHVTINYIDDGTELASLLFGFKKPNGEYFTYKVSATYQGTSNP